MRNYIDKLILISIFIFTVVSCTINPSDDPVIFSPLSILSPIIQPKINIPHIAKSSNIQPRTQLLTLLFFHDNNQNKIRDKGEDGISYFPYILRYFDPVTFRGATAEFLSDVNGNDFHSSSGHGLYRIRVGTLKKFIEIHTFRFDGQQNKFDIPVGPEILNSSLQSSLFYFPLIVGSDTCRSNWIARRMAEIFLTDFRQNRSHTACNEILSQVAQERAEDMAIRQYNSHTDPDGIGPNYKVEQAGCNLPDFYGNDLDSNNVESIAGGMNSPEASWAALMMSPGHRAHLLGEGGFSEQDQYGFGYARVLGSRFQYYYVYITAECL